MTPEDKAALLRIIAVVQTINQMASLGVTVEQCRRLARMVEETPSCVEDGGWEISP